MEHDPHAAAPSLDDDLPTAIVKRADGVYFKVAASAAACQAAVNQVFLSSAFFTGLDYAAFMKSLYNTGAEPPTTGTDGEPPLRRFADSVAPFVAARRE